GQKIRRTSFCSSQVQPIELLGSTVASFTSQRTRIQSGGIGVQNTFWSSGSLFFRSFRAPLILIRIPRVPLHPGLSFRAPLARKRRNLLSKSFRQPRQSTRIQGQPVQSAIIGQHWHSAE